MHFFMKDKLSESLNLQVNFFVKYKIISLIGVIE